MTAIIDYKAGNLTSVKLAFESLGIETVITDSPADILAADRVIFPGVGAAGSAMKNLNNLNLAETIRHVVAKGTPFLGICLGTQIIFEQSQEDGGVECIGLIPGSVRQFHPTNPYDKVPHMGWNRVKLQKEHPVFAEIDDNSEFYFVHSFYPAPTDSSWIIGTTEYAGVTFAAAVAHNNLVATQFHPEKSGKIGLQLLKNFCRWVPGNDSAPTLQPANNN
jgi:glutamine amidotransferase